MFIFLLGLGNSFRMRDKIQVFFFYKEMTWKIANVHVVHWLSMLWLNFEHRFLWYVMECKLFRVCVVSRGAEKTRFNLKMI